MSLICETERLSLRELVWSDLDFVAEVLSDREVMRFYPQPLDRDGAEQWLERQLTRYERDGHGLWLVTDRFNGEPLGQVGLAMQEVEGDRHPEIGYMIHRPFWRRGYASEAAAAARDYAFASLRYEYVISLIRPVNVPSQGVARKLGLQPVATVNFHGYEHQLFRLLRNS